MDSERPVPKLPSAQRRWQLVIVLALVAALGWTLIAWNRATALAHARQSALIEKESTGVARDAEAIAFNIGRNIAFLYGIPATVANGSTVIETLAKFGPDAQRLQLSQDERARTWLERADLAALNRHLALISRELGADVVFVMNASGDCIAASNYDSSVSLVGGNFADREYFQLTQSGARGRQYAMGRITNVPGLFFSAPVTSQGRFVGAVAAKIDLPRLSHWVDRANAFVVDGDGVVILARDKSLEMRALDGAAVFSLAPATRQAKYKRDEFAPIRFSPAPELGHPPLMRLNTAPQPYAVARVDLKGDDVAIYVVSRLDAIAEIERDRKWAFALLAFSGIAAILLAAGGAAYVVRAREYRRSMEQANTALHALNAKLGEQAATDPLTGCANRRELLEKLRQETARAERYRGALSMVVLDLDHFKAINDAHGHGAGDDALKHFCSLAQPLLRTQDTLGRIGGEEFAILLPDTTEAGAVALAERLRAQLERNPALYGSDTIAMTVSAGVVEWQPAGESPEALIRRGDEALYEAKRAGRNRVVSGAPTSATAAAAGV